MEQLLQTTSPTQNINDKNNYPMTEDTTSDQPSGSFTGGRSIISSTRFAEIIGIIGGLIVIVGFVVGVIITQININNNVENLTKSVDSYKNDNVLIKTQIENWFNKIDSKIDNIKDSLKK
jgi:hypothetical protein